MDSEQDIAAELERLNTQLEQIAAEEDITLSIEENLGNAEQSVPSGSGPADNASHPEAPANRPDSATAESKPLQAFLKGRLDQTQQQTSPSKPAQAAAPKPQQHGLHSFTHQLQAQQKAALPVDGGPSDTAGPAAGRSLALSEPMQPPPAGMQQGLLLQELLHQHGKLLDLLHILASNKRTNTNSRHKPHHKQDEKQQQQLAAADIYDDNSSDDLASDAKYLVLQEHYQSQLQDNHQLKKRIRQIQKVLLQHLQEAQLRAAEAEAACQAAERREQEAVVAAAALQVQLLQQQQDLQQQQHEFTAVRDQLQQVKDLHKQKLAQARSELKQQYDAQLQATTAAYARELAQIQQHLAGSKKRHVSKNAKSSTAAAAAAAGKQGQQAAEQDGGSARRLAAATSAARRPGQPGKPLASRGRSSTAAAAAAAADAQEVAAAAALTVTSRPVSANIAPYSAFADQQQQIQQPQGQGSTSQELHVPAEVVQYAQQYQQGGEGSTRPPTAPPSVLQRRRQQEQPVPEAAAQLAQHFMTGGEGISRPLTAPSSDHLMSRRSNSPTGRTSHSNRPSLRSITDSLVPPYSVAQYCEDTDGLCIPVGVDGLCGAVPVGEASWCT